jgi:methyl-accepting chemotaxis protein
MKLNQLRIGVRLGAGFGVLLALVALMMAIGIWRLSAMSDATREMMAMPLAKERLVSEWFRSVAVGVRRTTAIAKSSDPSLETVFAAEVKSSTVRGNEISKALDAMPGGENEVKLMAELNAARNKYLGARDAVMKAKREGHPEDSSRIFEADFVPMSKAYIEKMQALLDMQQAAIDTMAKSIEQNTAQARNTLTAIGGVALLFGAMFAVALTRSITRPVAQAKQLADAVAQGDLGHQLTIDGRDEIAELMQSLTSMNAGLRQMVASVRASTDNIGTASSEIATGNQDLSARTEQTASNLQQTASSMEQLTSAVKQSADSARQANQLATSAAEVAARGGVVVSHVVTTMDDINASSKKIFDIIGVIDGIAFQTNILALNAAVEAAPPANKAAASPWWRRKCAASPSVRLKRPRKSRASSARRWKRSKAVHASWPTPAGRWKRSSVRFSVSPT